MLSALLRSGDIKEYTALGQDGMAVYTVAPQLRDAIKIKRGRSFADYLAIPQRNDQGNKIDWYVPFDSNRPDGKYLIVPWTSATAEEREAALSELKVFERSILELGKEMASSTSNKGDQLLFSRLLCGGNPNDIDDPENLKALRFPNPEHVYLVNDRPVITFWGFTEKHSELHGSPFLNLKSAEPSVPRFTSEPRVETSAPVAAAATTQHHICCRFWWLLPLLLALLAFLAWWFKDLWLPKPEIKLNVDLPTVQAPLDSDVIAPKAREERRVDGRSYHFMDGRWVDAQGVPVTDAPLLERIAKTIPEAVSQCDAVPRKEIIGSTPVVGGGVAGNTVATDGVANAPVAENGADNAVANEPVNEAATDLQNNEQKEPLVDNPAVDPKSDEQANNQPVTPVDPLANEKATDPNAQNQNTPKPLEIPKNGKEGSVDFLNGKWNAGAGIQDKTTGKPLRLSYSFNNGAGQVQVQRGDGVQCVGNVSAKMQSGNLSIDNNGVAKCSDGSSYQLPNVSCKAGATSSADCQGAYGQGQRFPITMKSN